MDGARGGGVVSSNDTVLENEMGALLIPNPNADIPISTKLFPFAKISESPDRTDTEPRGTP